MKRYQVYLNPQSVSILEEVEKIAGIGRSKLIREAIDRFAENLAQVFAAKQITPEKTTILDSLVGSIKIKNKAETNFAQKSDAAYLGD